MMAVHGFTTRKCGLLPQHYHHRIDTAVVILIFFNIFCLRLCACGLKMKNNNDNINVQPSHTSWSAILLLECKFFIVVTLLKVLSQWNVVLYVHLLPCLLSL